jgi:hypothetical protein
MNAPHPVTILIWQANAVADDPETAEGELRHTLRAVAKVLEKQHTLIEAQRAALRRMAWQFGTLAILWFAVAGVFILRTVGWFPWAC